MPSRRRTWRRSAAASSTLRPRRRARTDDFFSIRWLRFAWRRRILPLPVTLKRAAAPRSVFIFGIVPAPSSSTRRARGGAGGLGRDRRARAVRLVGAARRLGLAGPLVRGEHHHHVPAVEARRGLDATDPLDVLGDAVEDPLAELGVVHLAPTEHDRDLHLVALGEEAAHLACLRLEVARADLRPVLHLLDADAARLAAGLLRTLRLVELELAVVHDPAHRRGRHRRHLDEVEVHLAGDGDRLRKQLDPELLAVGVDEANLTGPDAFVHPRLVGDRGSGDRASLLSVGTAATATPAPRGRRCPPARPPRTWSTRRRGGQVGVANTCAAPLPARFCA